MIGCFIIKGVALLSFSKPMLHGSSTGVVAERFIGDGGPPSSKCADISISQGALHRVKSSERDTDDVPIMAVEPGYPFLIYYWEVL